jgi:hypothetical protein
MGDPASMRRSTRLLLAAVVGLLTMQVHAQGQGGPSSSARATAPFDLTGYWVSVITQNWRFRMVTPAKGDYLGIPLTADAKKAADAWDPAKDQAAGNQCRSYGAATIMTLPERLHITWQDDNTLRMEIDAGTQTRLLHFGNWTPAGGKPTWQGDSVASWVARRGPGIPPSTPKSRYFKVTTTHMLPGYLRKNGVPYSENAVLTEYYDLFQETSGDVWLIVTTTVEDPVYLENPLILTAQFKKQVDASGWDPTSCSAKW